MYNYTSSWVRHVIAIMNTHISSPSSFSSLHSHIGCINHKSDVIMGVMASQIISLTSIFSIIYSDADQIKHQSSASLAFGRGIHRWPVNSLYKGQVTPKMFPIYDVIMKSRLCQKQFISTVVGHDKQYLFIWITNPRSQWMFYSGV